MKLKINLISDSPNIYVHLGDPIYIDSISRRLCYKLMWLSLSCKGGLIHRELDRKYGKTETIKLLNILYLFLERLTLRDKNREESFSGKVWRFIVDNSKVGYK